MTPEGEEPRRPVDSTMSLSAVGPDLEAPPAGVVGEALGGDELAAVEALPPGCALLIVARGPNAGSRFLLDAALTSAGRQPDSDIFLDDVTVSRRHAEFVRADPGFRVRDVGSLNGTYVNRDRVDDALLTAGDEVQIGKFRMTYHPSRRGHGGPDR